MIPHDKLSSLQYRSECLDIHSKAQMFDIAKVTDEIQAGG